MCSRKSFVWMLFWQRKQIKSSLKHKIWNQIPLYIFKRVQEYKFYTIIITTNVAHACSSIHSLLPSTKLKHKLPEVNLKFNFTWFIHIFENYLLMAISAFTFLHEVFCLKEIARCREREKAFFNKKFLGSIIHTLSFSPHVPLLLHPSWLKTLVPSVLLFSTSCF